jgi:glycosyltransferase involved in cell wall biosynthesis
MPKPATIGETDSPSGTVRLFAVIPAHNEGRIVGAVVRDVKARLPAACIVVVNDGSSDNTGNEAGAAGAHVLNLPFNCGYGVALQTGLLYASRHDADYVVTLDADGQHEPADLPKLLSMLQSDEADISLGSRYLPASKSYSVPILRRSASWLLSQVLSRLIGQKICDTTTGFQGLNKRALQMYLSMDDFPDRTPDADLLFYAHARCCRLVEVPVTMLEDTTGDSMHGIFKSMFYIPKMLVSLLSILIGYYIVRGGNGHVEGT